MNARDILFLCIALMACVNWKASLDRRIRDNLWFWSANIALAIAAAFDNWAGLGWMWACMSGLHAACLAYTVFEKWQASYE